MLVVGNVATGHHTRQGGPAAQRVDCSQPSVGKRAVTSLTPPSVPPSLSPSFPLCVWCVRQDECD